MIIQRLKSQTNIGYTSNSGQFSDGSPYGYHLHYDVINKDDAGINYQYLGYSNINNIDPETLFPTGTFS